MKISMPGLATIVAGVMTIAASAMAAPVTPTYDTFGALPAATFGGSGIPNASVAISTFANGDDNFTIGLTAHQRFFNPALTNDGAGTFYAGAGANFGNPAAPGGPGPSAFLGSTWNFAFYVNLDSPGNNFSDYDIDLFYDLDNGAGTDLVNLGRIDIDAASGSATLAQGSQNLLFAFLSSGAPNVFPPGSPSYNPFTAGEFSFLLQVREQGDTDVLGEVAINVLVPEPASIALLLAGAAGLAFGLRRRKPQA